MATRNATEFHDLPNLKSARQKWSEGNYRAAIDLFATTYQSNPKNLKACLEYASALKLDFQIDKAREVLRQAVMLADSTPTTIAPIGRAMCEAQLVSEAIELLQTLDPDPKTLAQLAVAYEELGDFEASLSTLQSIEMDGAKPLELQLIEVRILTHLREFDIAIPLVEDLIRKLVLQREQRVSTSPLLVIRSYYQYGLLLDYTGRYREAFQNIEVAKRIQQKLPQTNKQVAQMNRISTVRDNLVSNLDRKIIQTWQAEVVSSTPCHMAHLIGFPRSGTTLLEQVLDGSEDVVISSEQQLVSRSILPKINKGNEVTIDALRNLSSQQLEACRHQYALMIGKLHGEDAIVGKTHVDKRPSNISFLPQLIRTSPDAKFIVALRDPRDILVSCYLRYFPLTDMSACMLHLESATNLLVETLGLWIVLRDWMVPDSWMEVRYEELCDDVHSVSTEVAEFLNVSVSGMSDYRDQLTRKYVHSPSFADVRQPVYHSSIGRWRNYTPVLEPYLKRLRSIIEPLGYED